MSGETMLQCRRWAVVGATVEEDKFGYKIFKKLKDYGYEVYPISIKYDFIDGEKAYANLSELPVKPDVVDFVVNPKIGIHIIKECRELGIDKVWLQPGTVSEEILEYAEKNGLEAFQGCVLVALAGDKKFL